MWDDNSLIAATAEDFVLLVRTPTSDGYGGIVFSWQDGPTFSGVLKDDQGTTARIGAEQTGKTYGALFVPKGVDLAQFDAFRRVSDGSTYRVSEPNFNATPRSSDIDLRRYPVERWAIPE